jgi:hypothetical protein
VFVAIVTKNQGESNDIMTTVPGGSTPIPLGVVSPGERREFDLPTGARFVYPELDLKAFRALPRVVGDAGKRHAADRRSALAPE